MIVTQYICDGCQKDIHGSVFQINLIAVREKAGSSAEEAQKYLKQKHLCCMCAIEAADRIFPVNFNQEVAPVQLNIETVKAFMAEGKNIPQIREALGCSMTRLRQFIVKNNLMPDEEEQKRAAAQERRRKYNSMAIEEE